MASAVANPVSAAGEHQFLLRRLHSLSGIIPVGVFLINHLLTNSTAFLGKRHFDEHVRWIHDLPWLLIIEIVGVFIPLAFHAGYGVAIALQGRPNVRAYPYMDNWRYTLQRTTAWITLVFIVVHLLHFRFAHWFGLPDYKAAYGASYYDLTRDGFLSLAIPAWTWLVLYVVGLTAAVFHFCNGIVTFCITWGVTVGDRSRQYVSYGAAGLGVVLMAWGLLSLYAFAGPAEERPHKPPADETPLVVQV